MLVRAKKWPADQSFTLEGYIYIINDFQLTPFRWEITRNQLVPSDWYLKIALSVVETTLPTTDFPGRVYVNYEEGQIIFFQWTGLFRKIYRKPWDFPLNHPSGSRIHDHLAMRTKALIPHGASKGPMRRVAFGWPRARWSHLAPRRINTTKVHPRCWFTFHLKTYIYIYI